MTSSIFKDCKLRKGKWTIEEERYCNKIIFMFNNGYLNDDVVNGTTLRTYLSYKLHCDPMRITKKFMGESCIGKQLYTVSNTASRKEEFYHNEYELLQLQQIFYNRLGPDYKVYTKGNEYRCMPYSSNTSVHGSKQSDTHSDSSNYNERRFDQYSDTNDDSSDSSNYHLGRFSSTNSIKSSNNYDSDQTAVSYDNQQNKFNSDNIGRSFVKVKRSHTEVDMHNNDSIKDITGENSTYKYQKHTETRNNQKLKMSMSDYEKLYGDDYDQMKAATLLMQFCGYNFIN